MTNTSATLEATGITDATNTDDGPFELMRSKLLALYHSTQDARERIYRHSLPLEDGRLHVVVIRQAIGF